MKYLVHTLLVFLFFMTHDSMAQDELPGEVADTTVYERIEQVASFPGGTDSLMKFVRAHIRYPEVALENDITGTVVAHFIVEKDGSISNIIIDKGIGGGCDEEVIRLIASMPAWIPGEIDGKAVRVRMYFPVRFNLQHSQDKPSRLLSIIMEDPQMATFLDDRLDGGTAYFYKHLLWEMHVAGMTEKITEEIPYEAFFYVDKKGKISGFSGKFAMVTGFEGDVEFKQTIICVRCREILQDALKKMKPFKPDKSQKAPELIKFRIAVDKQ